MTVMASTIQMFERRCPCGRLLLRVSRDARGSLEVKCMRCKAVQTITLTTARSA